MQEPELPENEAARIATLHNLNVLDTPRHDRFDRYTRISTRIFDMPIALISLVDRYRQWFKSTSGFEGEETSRSVSFCGHAILGDDIFEIQNTRRDPRFRDNPLVLEQPHIRFYAGAPLEAPNGHKLGTLCLIDRIPRRLSDEEKVMLKNLADMVVNEMVNYVDTDTGLDNRNALLSAGSACFSARQEDRHFSLLLFDITDVVVVQSDADSQVPPGEVFARLLSRHFPDARSIASLGREDFCVLLDGDTKVDEAKAVNAVCSEAREMIYPDPKYDTFNPFAGRVDYDPRRYDSFVDMLHEADEVFFDREVHPSFNFGGDDKSHETLDRWRKTIF
ncbi:MAG: GAF domain-containing protein [Woeseiaceae bacterium]